MFDTQSRCSNTDMIYRSRQRKIMCSRSFRSVPRDALYPESFPRGKNGRDSFQRGGNYERQCHCDFLFPAREGGGGRITEIVSRNCRSRRQLWHARRNVAERIRSSVMSPAQIVKLIVKPAGPASNVNRIAPPSGTKRFRDRVQLSAQPRVPTLKRGGSIAVFDRSERRRCLAAAETVNLCSSLALRSLSLPADELPPVEPDINVWASCATHGTPYRVSRCKFHRLRHLSFSSRNKKFVDVEKGRCNIHPKSDFCKTRYFEYHSDNTNYSY